LSTATPKEHACCASLHTKPQDWYRSGMNWLLIGCAVLVGLSFLAPGLAGFNHAFLHYARKLWLPVVAGLLLGGLLDRFVPQSYVSKHLARPGRSTVFYAVGFGFLMSTCSHGLIALSMELHRKGASGPAIVSFLLASPWASLPITLLLFGLFGAKAILIVFGALVIAIVTGLIFQVLDRAALIEKNRHTIPVHADFSIRRDLYRRLREYRFSWRRLAQDLKAVLRGAWVLAGMTLSWTLVGLVVACLSSAFVPETFFHQYLGPSVLGLLATLAFAAVLEVCSEGMAPVAFEIYRQTGAFGNAVAFLMGGVVTDYTEIGLIWQNIGRRTAVWLLIVSLPQVFLLGLILNRF